MKLRTLLCYKWMHRITYQGCIEQLLLILKTNIHFFYQMCIDVHTNPHAPRRACRMHRLILELHTALVLTRTVHRYL